MSSGERQGAGGRSSAGDAPARVQTSAKPHAQSEEQKRAKLAWEWVQKAKGSDKRERYGTLTRKLPNYLQTSGFEQTMAFLFSKADGSTRKPEGLLFEQLVRRALGSFQKGGVPLIQANATVSQMMEALVNLSKDESRRAAQEAMRMAEWLRRFAPAELGEEK